MAGFAGGKGWGQQQADAQQLFGNQMQTGINFDAAHQMEVEVSPKDPSTPPMSTWEQGNLHRVLLANIQRCGYKSPTPVQKHGIPIALAGKDLVACAQTGSGKTAAFLLPVVHSLLHRPPQARGMLSALVLSPTRELSSQTFAEAQKFCYETGIRAVVVYGGTPMHPQITDLQSGCDILVGTPGRMCDHASQGRVNLGALRTFILDEADRMLDMGFEPQIRHIVTQLGMPRRRQTMMFSATFPDGVQRLAQDFVGSSYTFMTIGRVGSTHSHIRQKLVWVEDHDKRAFLLGVLLHEPGMCLVFCNTKVEANTVARFLREQGINSDAIHGDRTQAEREQALNAFRRQAVQVLVATDVAARGLDIRGVQLVVQYDMPTDVDDYVHRTGRTGRAGNVGLAIGMFNNRNKGLSPELCPLLEDAKQDVPAWLRGMAYSLGGSAERKGGQFGGQDVRAQRGYRQRPAEKEAFRNFDAMAYGADPR
eukprot:TRINITY_DN2307_c1_g1_i1.p1 TRINITY_DN2307_c1_g1~~TRINITY_DN2307_c1_g1_i1.p1  ORF type:complete len:504 (+),score=143.05 TRINITY_DN2307_c1_g1_i1:78-1514(+)